MVLRKPYAFLIKNFKKIHLSLSLILIYIAFKYNNIITFVNSYISNYANSFKAKDYISYFLIFMIIVAIAINFIIFLVMRYKKKPKVVYMFNMIGLVVNIVFLFIAYYYFNVMANEIIEQKTIRLVRDLLKMGIYFQYINIVFMLIRGLGFDIKKFNFNKDLEQLNIDEKDNEEVEVVIGFDSTKIKRKARRTQRELKYYFKENKKVIIFLLVAFILFIGIKLYLNINVTNKIYNEKETFKTTNLNMEIIDSYLTQYSKDKEDVGYNNTSYVILKFKVKNLNEAIQVNTDDILLKTNNNSYSPTKKYYSYFTDIGIGYKKQTINEEKEYILVYNIKDKDISDEMILSYKYGYYNNGDIAVIKVKITPESLDKSKLISTVSINEKLDFKNSPIEGANLIIGEYHLEAEDENAVLTLNYKADLNNKLTIQKLFNTHTKLKYEYDDLNYPVDNYEVDFSDNQIIITTDKEVLESNNIWLELEIRNSKYKYKIVEN